MEEEYNVAKNKNFKGLIIGGAILLVLIIAVVAALVITSQPKFIIGKAIDKIVYMDNDYNSKVMEAELKLSLDSKNENVKELSDEIKKCKLTIGQQIDKKSKKAISELGLTYDNKDVISGQIIYTDDTTYLYLKDLLDKYIDLDSEEMNKMVETLLFNDDITKNEKNNQKKAVNIIKKELKKQIKENGSFSKSTEKLEGEKANKATVKFSKKEWNNVLINTLSELSENKDYLDCFKDSKEDTIKELKSSLEEKNTSDNGTIEISVYTKGLLKQFKGIEIKFDDQDVKIVKKDKENYSYSLIANDNEVTGTAKIISEDNKKSKEKNANIIITVNTEEVGTVTLSAKYNEKTDVSIDSVKIKDSIKASELTDSDAEQLMNKLKTRPLIGDIINSISSNLLSGNLSLNSNEDDDNNDNKLTMKVNGEDAPVTEITLGDGTVIYPNSNDDDDDNNTTNGNTTSTSTGKNYVENGGIAVEYSVPSGYTTTSTSKNYIYYTKRNGDISKYATVAIRMKTESNYKKEIESKVNNYKKDASYKNVTLEPEQTIKQGNKQFKYQVLSYEYGSTNTKYQYVFLYTSINSEYIYNVELNTSRGTVDTSDIKTFANITIK